MSTCSKPGCTRPGGALLSYDYQARLATLTDPPEVGEVSPHLYVLCTVCAEKLNPPRGWLLDDMRSEPPLFVTPEREPAPATPLPVVLHEEGEEEAPFRRQLFFGSSA